MVWRGGVDNVVESGRNLEEDVASVELQGVQVAIKEELGSVASLPVETLPVAENMELFL